jgi:hypothetical protein
MNDKDKEALHTWIDNDALSPDETTLFKGMSDQERVIFAIERTWQAACEYMQAELAHHIFKTEHENKKLREALELSLKANLELWEMPDVVHLDDHGDAINLAIEALKKVEGA